MLLHFNSSFLGSLVPFILPTAKSTTIITTIMTEHFNIDIFLTAPILAYIGRTLQPLNCILWLTNKLEYFLQNNSWRKGTKQIFDCVTYCGIKLFIISRKFRNYFKKHKSRKRLQNEEIQQWWKRHVQRINTYDAIAGEKQAYKGPQHYLQIIRHMKKEDETDRNQLVKMKVFKSTNRNAGKRLKVR